MTVGASRGGPGACLNITHCAPLRNRPSLPQVVKAFLTHDLATLRQHCGPELMERFSGIFRHFEAEVRLWAPAERRGAVGAQP